MNIYVHGINDFFKDRSQNNIFSLMNKPFDRLFTVT